MGYVRKAHNVYISAEKMNRHLRSKRKGNDLDDVCVSLFTCRFRPLASDWGMQSSKLNSKFETKARSVWTVVQIRRKAAVQERYQISSYFLSKIQKNLLYS